MDIGVIFLGECSDGGADLYRRRDHLAGIEQDGGKAAKITDHPTMS